MNELSVPASPVHSARTGRDLRILWWTNAVDGVGTQASGIVLPLLVLDLGHSAATAGAFASAVAVAGVVLGPVVARPADHGHRRALLIGSATVAAVAMAGLTVCLVWWRPPLWTVLGLAFVERLCAFAHEAAARGALARVARPDEVTRGAAGLQAGDQAALVVGPGLGGALFEAGRPLPFLADALSYAATALGIRALRTPLDGNGDGLGRKGRGGGGAGAAEDGAGTTAGTAGGDGTASKTAGANEPGPGTAGAAGAEARAGLGAGFRVVVCSPLLRVVLAWASAASVVVTLLSYTALFVLDGGAAVGLVLSASGAAGLAGALLAPVLVARLGARRSVILATWLSLVPCGLLVTADGAGRYAAGFALLALLLPTVTVVLSAAMARTVPRSLQSQAGAAVGATAALVAAGCPALAAGLLAWWGPHAPAALCLGLLALLAGYTQARVGRVAGGAQGGGGHE
ncbi:MFS transporter [Streptomyces broussonetiae]|uniref:MFS transporter n=1 Tax=Streptomyces broussonetiae TaxID=2686304 RepID=A0ABV5EI05_9ACTN